MADTDVKAAHTIRNHVLASLGVGLVPLPWVDLAALAALQLNLVRRLASLYGVAFSEELGKSALSALIGAGVPLSLSANLRSLSKSLPGLGWVVASASSALFAAASTYALGKVFVQHFESGNTLLNFNAEQTKAYYRQQFEQGKREARQGVAGLRP
ncbi:MAG: DUF697 domain-containing protein [Thiohalocapsa sp. PB-PSB1]|jgi:uncharacterized protein (DUF697 family)|nr:MAG: hypothetical protein N838_29320 [Thiohalocapsa sp. PB-PSB1]QQO55022.1 MAG: DUF697 domain-containing protein [Thiohalocapsa sp. PB-PSB1]HCS91636.1 DUF697 domain-containing protein [Chromatiaceae bacterium]